jgi:TonB-linked SusC/RagA family outer membrane protein
MKERFTRLISGMMMLLFIVATNTMKAQTNDAKITVEAALKTIAKKYNTKFAYEHEVVQGKFTPLKSMKAKNLEEALKQVLYPNNLLFLYVSDGNYTIIDRDERLFAPKTSTVIQIETGNRDIYIQGKVLDEAGNPIPGVSIKGNASNAIMATDANGSFNIYVDPKTTIIGFSYIGYETYSYSLNGSRSNLVITLNYAAANQLNEVEVISTGLQKISKERSTGSAELVTAKQLEKIPVPNLLYRMESMVPGVKVNINAGDNSFLYGNTRNSINSSNRTRGASDYNFSVRGRSTLQGESFPLIVVDGAITENDISAINPNDVENVTFLKDAAAASIWGTRAANGVMVITTKSGKVVQAPSVNFSATASVSNAPDLDYLRMMNAAQTIAYEQEIVAKGLITAPNNSTAFGPNVANVTDLAFKLKAGTITQAAYDNLINQYAARDNKDQVKQYLLQPASSQSYNFSVSGGNNYSTYFYGVSYSKETPYAVGKSGERLTVTLNNSFKLFKTATLNTNLKGAFFNYKNNSISLNSLYGPSSVTFMPYQQLVDDNGNRVSYSKKYYTGWLNSALYPKGFLNWEYNALNEMDNADNTQSDNIYSANFNLNVPILKGLSANAFFNTERSFTKANIFYNENTYFFRDLINTYTNIPTSGTAVNNIGLATGGSGIYNTTNANTNNYTLRGQLNYETKLGNNHQINAIAGAEIRQTKQGESLATLYGYNMGTGISRQVNFFTPYSTITNALINLSGSPSQADKTRRYLSYYSNAAYTYKSRYTISGSVRYDDYNNFGLDRSFRATPLYSFGAKWDAAKEPFLKGVSAISNLSLRATYGVNGNISTGLYPFTFISLGSNDASTGLPTASIIAPANPELRWEKTYVSNIGLDFGFLQNKITGSAEVYRKHSTDLFYSFPINGTYGITTLTRNTSKLTGKGVDVSLSGIFYAAKDWDVNGRLTYAYNTNEIEDSRFIPTSSFYSSPAYGSFIQGYPTDKLLVFRNAGLDATGMTLVYDQNGNKIAPNQSITTIDALINAGRTTAPHFGSYTQSIRFKDFTLMAVATYQFGNVFLKPTISSYPSSRLGLTYDLSEDVAKRWQKAGDEATTNVPGVAGTYASVSLTRYQQSDINVLKGDYIRLRELSLSYRIPVEHLTKIVKSASFAFSARNIGLLWTANKEGIDPDFIGALNSTTLGLPATVSYNFSLNANF